MLTTRSLFCRCNRLATVTTVTKKYSNNEITEPTIPPYEEKIGEPLTIKKARLLYQSRKRGMLENGILLSTFAAKYLKGFNEEETKLYDRLINLPSNDWDIYNWATGIKPTPSEFDHEIMKLLKDFVQNKDRVMKIRQPDLDFST